MKYDVLGDFELPGGKAEPVLVKAGTVWIPAETGVPKHEVSRLLNEGAIALIKKEVPADVETGDESPAPTDKPARKPRN